MLFIDTCPAERHCIYHQTIAALGDTTLQAILRPDLIESTVLPSAAAFFIPRRFEQPCYRRLLLSSH
jgi:hypothetical protein